MIADKKKANKNRRNAEMGVTKEEASALESEFLDAMPDFLLEWD